MGNATSFTINIDNQLTDDLTLNDYQNPPDMGKWSTTPVTTIDENTIKNTAAKVLGKTCSMYGSGANMTYGISNGTTFIIKFSAPYGSSSPTISATASGSRAANYVVTHTSVSGYNPTSTVTIAPAS